jgi:predicted O-methyltransferase YrrM
MMLRKRRPPEEPPAERAPRYDDMTARVPALCHVTGRGETAWYPPVMIGAGALAEIILSRRYVELALGLLRRLEPDDYSRHMIEFYADGLARFGATWRYADIVTVLLGLTETLKPRRYLEIGVRRGRSACAVASLAPTCDLLLLDMWIAGYAGMDNPGPALVRSELARVGHRGRCDFIDGDSHETLPRYFAEHPSDAFDLVTVDGDHSDDGATQDLCDVLPRLAVGGAVVFDDIGHPAHPGLFDDAGYGVGFAVRRR